MSLIDSGDGASAGIHFNLELNLLYDDNDGDGKRDRGYASNAALDHDVTQEQLQVALKYWNSVRHYNLITNNCAEIATKTWNKAFNDDLDGRMWTSTFKPNSLKNSIEKRVGSYSIDFRSDKWTNVLNKEVVG